MKFTPGFLADIIISWVNHRFVVAPVQRQLVLSWSARMVDAAVNSSAAGSSFGTVFDVVDHLVRLVPHEVTIAALIRTVVKTFVLPTFSARDKLVADVDGYASTDCSVCSACG